MKYLYNMSNKELRHYITPRKGENRIGEAITLLDEGFTPKALYSARQQGCKFALIGIPEDIGPRANLGRSGAIDGWEAFLDHFLNQQNNQFLDMNSVLLVGSIDCSDLLQKAHNAPPDALRYLCSQIDERVSPVINLIMTNQLIPIVIGGGHNNCYPIIRGAVDSTGRSQVFAAINCDPHADFRPLEGRHSGNGFSWAMSDNFLRNYFIFGLQEAYNSEEVLQRIMEHMKQGKVDYITYESLFVRNEYTFKEALDKAAQFMLNTKLNVGLELDMDSIIHMPTSAMTPYGITLEQAAQYIHHMAKTLPCAYLHLPESAPSLSMESGERVVGRALSLLVSTFMKAILAKKED